MKTLQILAVEDQPVVQAGLRLLLDATPDLRIVHTAATLQQARQTLLTTPGIDVVLLDLRLPDGMGYELLKDKTKFKSQPKYLVLSSILDDATVRNAVEAGVDGYLLKDADPDTLLQAIRNVFAGTSAISPKVTQILLDQVRHGKETYDIEQRLKQISPQENKILLLVAKGMTNPEIAAQLNLSDKTVKNYLTNAMDKLGVNRRSQVAVLVSKHLSA